MEFLCTLFNFFFPSDLTKLTGSEPEKDKYLIQSVKPLKEKNKSYCTTDKIVHFKSLTHGTRRNGVGKRTSLKMNTKSGKVGGSVH